LEFIVISGCLVLLFAMTTFCWSCWKGGN